MLYYEFEVSMDCTESKGYSYYIILQLTTFQVDANSCF